jgi:hypothetical protein
MKLIDYLSMYKGWVDLDVFDTKIDTVIHIGFERENLGNYDEHFPYMSKFTELLLQKVDISYFVPDGVPVCDFSKLINDNAELFKKHIKKHWIDSMQWAADDDTGEFEYEIIKEFDSVINGRYGETVNKQYYETLKKCKE